MSPRVSPHAVCASLDGGAVVLHMVTKRYFTLNESGAYIWSLLEQEHSAAEVVERVCETFAVSAADAQTSVLRLMAELGNEQLLVQNT